MHSPWRSWTDPAGARRRDRGKGEYTHTFHFPLFAPAKSDLLILDELSYLSFNRHQSELLFKVISDRSEKSSTIVTTNLPFSKWTELFENTTMVAALLDRLTFRSHVLDMNGDSYRLKATMQKRA